MVVFSVKGEQGEPRLSKQGQIRVILGAKLRKVLAQKCYVNAISSNVAL